MKIPYHGLLVSGDVLLAARGCNLHTFSIKDGSHLFTWKYPSLRKDEPSDATPARENGSSVPTPMSCDAENPNVEDGDSGPPPKRRKVENSEEVEQEEPDQEMGQEGGEKHPSRRSKRRAKKKKSQALHPVQRPAEPPMIQCLTATTDGKHVVAVTGSDKTIWVFEHDGAGNLVQLGQRTMPKRPCSIVLTPDNKTILSADKFGDVFSLPLIPNGDPAEGSPQSAPSTPATPATPQPAKPQANTLTVHTKRNLKALANQNQRLVTQQVEKARTATFEHTLLLGHVSMLTAIALTTRAGRSYIVTGDRDEHIRVSRPPPQAHVIEAYCLGHDEFVSRLCAVPGRPELLVSGGGDDDLFVWDWFAGALLSTADLLPLVCAVLPEAAQLAVSTLRAFHHPGGTTWVVAACEAVPVLFCFRLEGNSLQHAQTVPLAGNLLDAVTFDTERGLQLLAALDAPRDAVGDPSLVTLGWDGESGSWQPSPFPVADEALDDGEADITREELTKSLYSTETTLRKMGHDDE